MAELLYFTGTMDCGKSTLALQMDHNHKARGRLGKIFTSNDRAGESTLSSRLGLVAEAIEVRPDFDFWQYVVGELTHGGRIDYVVCDEAQFYQAEQIEQLARLADELQIDVFCFGILTDFRARMFPGSARLVELADRMELLQVEALCWCGERATHNARTIGGEMVTEGEQLVVGDMEKSSTGQSGADLSVPDLSGPGLNGAEIAYEVLCRRHHRRRLTAARARATLSPEVLPFGGAV